MIEPVRWVRYDTCMSESTPFLPGYLVAERHTCSRCGRLARVRYAAEQGEGPELEPAYRYGFEGVSRLAGFPGGSIALMSAHAPVQAEWFYGSAEHCGFGLVAGSAEPESLINAVYRMLVRYESPAERITRFDLAAFAAAPFSVLATSDTGGAPLRLIAAPALLRSILSTGTAPNSLRLAFEAGEAPADELRRRFIGMIGAETRPLA